MEGFKQRYQDDQTMRQWCKLKEENMTDVIFVQKGKFYEVFHTDADICAQHLGAPYMKGEDAHTGFPLVSCSKFKNKLEGLGYTVRILNEEEV